MLSKIANISYNLASK